MHAATSSCRKSPDGTRRTSCSEDVGALDAAIDERYRPMVWIGALLGLRWGEDAGLRFGRIDLLGRLLSVTEIVTRDAHGGSVVGPPQSVAGIRTLSMPRKLAGVLAEHFAGLGLMGSDTDSYVFEAPGGGPLSYSSFRRRIWQPAISAAGLEGVGSTT
jgi:integrase